MKRLLAASTIMLALLGASGPALATPGDGAPEAACVGTLAWSSTEHRARPLTSPSSTVVDARAGGHRCYDRLVIDVDGRTPGYVVRYVTQFRQLASNQVIPLAGGARLEILVRAPAVDSGGHPTYPGVTGQRLPGVDLGGFETFRSAKYGGTFEGITQFGLGVRARLPFRVLKLDDHVVIDVAHHW